MEIKNEIRRRRAVYNDLKKLLLHSSGFCNALNILYDYGGGRKSEIENYPELLELKPSTHWKNNCSYWFIPSHVTSLGLWSDDGRQTRHNEGYKVRIELLNKAIESCDIKLKEIKT